MKLIFLDIDGVMVVGDDPQFLSGMALVDGEHMHHLLPSVLRL